ncbi:hypothetical protein B296_00053928 [Ensete ventricosum]|uniref:NAD(P)-binding domain-containing protein n=1 Tax=Ensete ventricosum TaxID=4639 RepID=A0A426Y5U5_ENSVE|nr:hypothetical protein B296_00053928 [Ensete ventricosum]
MVTNVISCTMQLPINPYGKAKKMAEDIILDFSKRSDMAVVILRSVADGNNFRPGDYAEVYSDPAKINHELNWTARYTDLQESLSIAWKWQKSHPNGYGTRSVMAV